MDRCLIHFAGQRIQRISLHLSGRDALLSRMRLQSRSLPDTALNAVARPGSANHISDSSQPAGYSAVAFE